MPARPPLMSPIKLSRDEMGRDRLRERAEQLLREAINTFRLDESGRILEHGGRCPLLRLGIVALAWAAVAGTALADDRPGLQN